MQESRLYTFNVGLTGGIGSGKTTVSNLFHKLGSPVVDADEISHELVSKGSPLLDTILDHFGFDIQDASGGLNRHALRERVFHDPGARAWLEALLHPAIREEIRCKIAAVPSGYVIVVIPLLAESSSYDFLDRILVVDVPEALQISRTQTRDGSPQSLVEKILASQATRQKRLALADDIIDNSGSLAALEKRVDELHVQYSQMAASERK